MPAGTGTADSAPTCRPSYDPTGESNVEADKHLIIIRSRLERLLGELTITPSSNHVQITDAIAALLHELDGKESATSESTGRAITLTELRQRLTGMPGAGNVLEAIDAALADGAD